MQFKHFILFLKSKGQYQNAKSKEAVWEEMDKNIGKWMKENGEDAKQVLSSFWKDGETEKIPVLYGKQGKLSLMSLDGTKPYNAPTNTTNYSVLEDRYHHLFTHVAPAGDVVSVFKNEIQFKRILEEKLNNIHWTYTQKDEVKELSRLVEENLTIWKQMHNWHHSNLPNDFREKLLHIQKRSLGQYLRHVEDCIEEQPTFSLKKDCYVVCDDCGTHWSYQQKTGEFDELPLDYEREQIESFLAHYEQTLEQKKKIEETIAKIEARFTKKQLNAFEKIQQEIEHFLKEIKGSELDVTALKNILQKLNQPLETKKLASYKKHLLSIYTVEKVIETLETFETMDAAFETEESIKEHKKIWKKTFQEHRNMWEDYQKNPYKYTPYYYQLASYSFTMGHMKDILTFILQIDGKYGYHVIAEALCGLQNEKITKYKLHQYAEYGIFKNYKKENVLEVLKAIEVKGYILQTKGEYPKIQVTKRGGEKIKAIIQKEILLKSDSDVLAYEREVYFAQPLSSFSKRFHLPAYDPSWKTAYMKKKNEEIGISFYRKMLAHYKDAKKEQPFIRDFLIEAFEEKYKPIFEFYYKTAKNEYFKTMAKQLISTKGA